MKINRVVEGKYAEIKLEDDKRIFLSVLPDRITVSTMVLTWANKKIWEFVKPVYMGPLRTVFDTTDTAKQMLRIILKSIEDAKNLDELQDRLENQVVMMLGEFIEKLRNS